MTPEPQITPREAEILSALGERLTNAEIAARFHIGIRTVESHVSALLRKLGALDRRELAALDPTARRPTRLVAPPHLSVSMLGRDNDVIAISQLLSESRLVTLFGPGGVGKSTLALALVEHDEISSDRDRAYVDIARLHPGEDVAAGLATSLGVERDTRGSWIDRMAEAVGARRLLIVLDNAEGAIDATASLVNELLRRVKGIAFLVTAREPLSIAGERLWPVEPLAVTDEQAIALFRDRAAAVRPDWAAGDDVRETVAVICRRLDGLPLAIELAASEVRARSVDDIARRLDQPLALLEHGDRTDARHRTLRAVMDWSYDLLDPDEQAVFDRLGAFVAGFSMTEAQSLCSDLVTAEQIERIVVGLVARSLVRLRSDSSQSRYDMLDTIRHYALDHLATTGDIGRVHERHAVTVMASVADAVEGLWGPDESRSVACLDETQADILNAYRWLRDRGAIDDLLRLAVQCYLFGWSHGRSTMRELAGDAIAILETGGTTPTSPELVALAYGAAAAAAVTAGDVATARRLSEKGLEQASEAGEPSARLCYGAVADLALFAGDTNAAADHYRAAAEGFRNVGGDAMAAYLDAASGLALAYGGNAAEAEPIVGRSLAAADVSGCPSARAFARYATAELAAANDTPLARQRLEEAIDLAESVSATFVAGIAELSLATLEARTGDHHSALGRYAKLIDVWRLAGNWTQQWNTLRTLVFVLADLRRYRAAAELMAAIAAAGAAPTWGDDAAGWAKARDLINMHLEPVMIETIEIAAKNAAPSDVLDMVQAHVAVATRSATIEGG